MSDNEDTQTSEVDSEIQREIREGRKFTLAEAIGRLAGPGAMKGESPVARMQQAEIEIESFHFFSSTWAEGASRLISSIPFWQSPFAL